MVLQIYTFSRRYLQNNESRCVLHTSLKLYVRTIKTLHCVICTYLKKKSYFPEELDFVHFETFGGIKCIKINKDFVETRMVGSELNIFSNNHWRIYQISVGGLLYIYGDLLESPQKFCRLKSTIC